MTRKCKVCEKEFQAKPSDVSRGWGNTCSKSCAAKLRESKKPIDIKQFVEVEISSDKTKLTLEQKIFHMLSDTNENWCGTERFKEITEKRTDELSKIMQDHLNDVGIDQFLLEINYFKFISELEFSND